MKRYKCKDCGSYISIMSEREATICPACDGELVLCDPPVTTLARPLASLKIQYISFEDGAEELLISGSSESHAFRYGRATPTDDAQDWQPMGLVDMFKPLSKIKGSLGRIF